LIAKNQSGLSEQKSTNGPPRAPDAKSIDKLAAAFWCCTFAERAQRTDFTITLSAHVGSWRADHNVVINAYLGLNFKSANQQTKRLIGFFSTNPQPNF
jgi:hypothetical protein